MKFCPYCGTESSDDAIFCNHCGNPLSADKQEDPDKPSVGLCLLAVFIPLFGLIYWPVEHNATPKKSTRLRDRRNCFSGVWTFVLMTADHPISASNRIRPHGLQ